MCYTRGCPYQYGRDGDCCKWLEESGGGEPPEDAACYVPDENAD